MVSVSDEVSNDISDYRFSILPARHLLHSFCRACPQLREFVRRPRCSHPYLCTQHSAHLASSVALRTSPPSCSVSLPGIGGSVIPFLNHAYLAVPLVAGYEIFKFRDRADVQRWPFYGGSSLLTGDWRIGGVSGINGVCQPP